MNQSESNLWLIGTGPHAREYAKVLLQLDTSFEVIGRGELSALEFTKVMGKNVLSRDLKEALNQWGAPKTAIVSVSFDQLASVSIELLNSGTRLLLIEKPGGLNSAEILNIRNAASKSNAKVYIGYNRRFYSSTQFAKNKIEEDGGAISCFFEFTEWSSAIEDWNVSTNIKNALMIANSSHVVDLAFYLCGKPKDWKSFHSGTLPWHPSAARFSGAGETEKGILFSYHADWEAPGRWGVEVMTRYNRYIFRPMEQLHVVKNGSIKIEQVLLDDSKDKNFKPGLYNQTKSFLDRNFLEFCSLEEQVDLISIYSQMAGYV